MKINGSNRGFNLIAILALSLAFASCNEEAKEQCRQISKAKIYAPQSVTVGDELVIRATEVGGYRVYNWKGPSNFTSQDPDNIIYNVGLRHQGTYSVHLYTLEDKTCEIFDEAHVEVLLRQGTPACTVAVNTFTFSNMGATVFNSIVQSKDASSNQKKLTLNSSGGTAVIYFHPNWAEQDIKTGIYYTTNTSSMDQVDWDYNKVFISITKSNIYWATKEFHEVYVTNMNGKLTVKFCGLEFLGSNGSSWSTIASGNIIEP